MDIGAYKLDASKLPFLLVPPRNSDWGPRQIELISPPYLPMHDPFYQFPGSTIMLPGANLNSSKFEFQDWRALEPKGNEASFVQQNCIDKYKLFGVNLFNCPEELPSPQVISSSELQSPYSIPPNSQSSISESIQASEPSKSVSGDLSDKQCNNCCSATVRSCTKVI